LCLFDFRILLIARTNNNNNLFDLSLFTISEANHRLILVCEGIASSFFFHIINMFFFYFIKPFIFDYV
jgi:hypothetical protein